MTKVPVYKKKLTTEYRVEKQVYIYVGQVDDYGFIEFNPPNKEILATYPTSYDPRFYVDYKFKSTNGEMYDDYVDISPRNAPIQMLNFKDTLFSGLPSNYPVTGYVTNDGIAVYYDQFFNQ